MSFYATVQWQWFVKTLRKAKEGQEGRLLKKLIIFDCIEDLHSLTLLIRTDEVKQSMIENEEKRREVFISLLRPLFDSIGRIAVKSRKPLQWRLPAIPHMQLDEFSF